MKPYRLLTDGKFDMDLWNDDYWNRFQNMLEWTYERDIIVQIEVWDRFDYSRNFWINSLWNPVNNINYTYEETGLAPEYPEHPNADVHPFFHTVKGMKDTGQSIKFCESTRKNSWIKCYLIVWIKVLKKRELD